MSNPTELPDLAEAVRKLVNAKGRFHTAQNYAEVVEALARHDARRAQPEGEAPQAKPVAWMVPIEGLYEYYSTEREARQARESLERYMSDDPEEVDHVEPIPLYEHPPAVTLSPLCGAQHAESGKEDWTDERIEELFKAKCGRWQSGDEGGFWIVEDADLHPLVRTILAQQAAAPGALNSEATRAIRRAVRYLEENDCTGPAADLKALLDTPAATSAPGTPEAPTDPLDTALPCDIKVGNGTIRKGCKLRTLVARMESLHRMAMAALPLVTPEQRVEFDSLFQSTAMSGGES